MAYVSIFVFLGLMRSSTIICGIFIADDILYGVGLLKQNVRFFSGVLSASLFLLEFSILWLCLVQRFVSTYSCLYADVLKCS